MSDRNPMLQNLNNPVAGLGIIPGKALLDDDLIDARRANARNPLRAATCYPGGEDKLNHNAEPGDLVFGRRGQRDVESMDGEPNEYVTASVSGLCWNDYNSHRAMERDHYFVGVAAGSEHVEHPYSDQPDARNGFATVRVGTVSVINNGDQTFYPGDLVAWRFPACGLTPGAKYSRNLRQALDDVSNLPIVHGGDPDHPGINYSARYGEEPGKFRPEIVPFNPTDLDTDLGGVFSAITTPFVAGGVSDKPFSDVLPNPDDQDGGNHYNLLQDEALSYKYGILGIFSAMLGAAFRYNLIAPVLDVQNPGVKTDASEKEAHNNTRKVLERMGVFGKSQNILDEAFADVFLKHIGGENAVQDAAIQRFQTGFKINAYDAAVITPTDTITTHARMQLNAMDNLVRGMARTIDEQRSRIIGRCTSASAPGDTTDILLGHTI